MLIVVLGPAHARIHLPLPHLLRNGDAEHYVLSRVHFFEIGFQLYFVLDGSVLQLADADDLEGHFCALGDAICHESELLIWGDKSDGPLLIKLVQLHTLVELYVLDCRDLAPTTVKQQLLIQPELAGWHPA